MTATLRPLILTAVAFAALAAFPAVASADDDQGSPATQLATNDQELLLTFAAGLVDECHLFLCPIVVGGAAGYSTGSLTSTVAVAIVAPVWLVSSTLTIARLWRFSTFVSTT